MAASLTDHRIAVVGMACSFPGAHSPTDLWTDVLAGRRAFRALPDERLPAGLYHDPDPAVPDKTYCDQVAIISDWQFDPVAFRIPPVTFEATDPTHWLALSTAERAFADAGLDLPALDRARVGVVLGNTLGGEFGRSANLRHRWPYVERAFRLAAESCSTPERGEALKHLLDQLRRTYVSPLPKITEDSLAGTMSNTIAGRICNHFDLGGGGYTVDGACSSSLLAVAQACDALVRGELDVALAGGVDISLDPYELIGFAKAHALAADDIRPYDERAAGMLPGEGCGLVVLMRADTGRRARAIIRGWGYSTDGRGGMTAPRLEGQIRAMRKAYDRAGYPLWTVGLIEGHGTGTTLGDQVELAAILDLLRDAPPGAKCLIGSIKGNIGHCKAAAGAAGLIKAVMALERKILPPTAGCERPHSSFGRPFGVLAPALDGACWDRGAHPRRASVSAFGFGGSNAHVTLEEASPEGTPAPSDLELLGSGQSAELVLVSAPDRRSLLEHVERIGVVAARISRAELTDLAAALARTDTGGAHRLAIHATSPRHLVGMLQRAQAFLAGTSPLAELSSPREGVFAGMVSAGGPTPVVVALFPGQGSQRPEMATAFASRYSFVRAMYEQFNRAVSDLMPEGVKRWSGAELRGADGPLLDAYARELQPTDVAQPAIVAASLATLRILDEFGLRPQVMLGHSLGEITALVAAGAIEPVMAVRIAALRGRAMAGLELPDPGGMAAVAAEPDAVVDFLDQLRSDLVISNYNSPRQTVVSGRLSSIRRFLRECRRRRLPCRRLPVSHAFHSEIVTPAAEVLQRMLEGVPIGAPRGTVISTALGDVLAAAVDVRLLLSEQVRRPVRFLEAVRRAAALRPGLWIEVGPGGVLAGLVGEILEGSPAPVLTTDRPGTDPHAQIEAAVGQAFVLGVPIAAERLFAHRFHRPFALDGYAPRFIVNPCERLPAHVREDAQTSRIEEAGEAIARDRELDATILFVKDWIARRTGYPLAAISPTMRLRDNLGLDSLKAMELLHALTTHANHKAPLAPGWENFQIDEVVAAVLKNRDAAAFGSGGANGAAPNAAPPRNGGHADDWDDWIESFQVGTVEAPIKDESPLLPPRVSILVLASPGCWRASAIRDAIAEAGFAPTIVPPLRSALEAVEVSRLGAIVWVLPEQASPWFTNSPEELAASIDEYAGTLFELGRWLVSRPSSRDVPVRWLVLRPDRCPEQPRAVDAGAAFLKSLRLEHRTVLPKWIRVPSSVEPASLGELVVAELLCGGGRVSYVYDAAGRRLTDAALPIEVRECPLTLDESDVVLITGGAKGITRELTSMLAEETTARFALVGTSAEASPEVRTGLARLAFAAPRVRYFCCDVTDRAAVVRLFNEVERAMGPVTALLHGAGATAPESLDRMSFEAYRQCIRLKADGLRNLLAARSPAQLKAVHVLSSVLGYTGMARQVDYTYANAWLDGAAVELQAAHPKLNVLAIAYSVWRNTGLGKQMGAVDVLAGIGVTAIEEIDGVAAYRAALDDASTDPRRIVTGRLVPELEATIFPPPPRGRARFLEHVVRWVPGIEIVADAVVSLDRDPYLRDHVFDGTPILPAVMGLDAMVAAARACSGIAELPVIHDLRLRRAIVVPHAAEVRIRVHALVQPSLGRSRRVRVTLRAQADGFGEDCFTAMCAFGEARGLGDVEPLQRDLSPRELRPEDAAWNALFQGPFFRRLVALRCLEPGTCVADVALGDNERYFGPDIAGGLCTPFPAARDAFLQTLLLASGGGALPTAIRRIEFSRAAPGLSRAICRGRVCADQTTPSMDVDVFTLEGEPIEAIRGVSVDTVGLGQSSPLRSG